MFFTHFILILSLGLYNIQSFINAVAIIENHFTQVVLKFKPKMKHFRPLPGLASFVNPLRCTLACAAWKACREEKKLSFFFLFCFH